MDVYDTAREYAAEAEQQAQSQVGEMDIETLRKEYVALTGMVAYYTKIEREMTKPRMHIDAIKDLLKKIRADNLIMQAAQAEEQGVALSIARVPAVPLLQLIDRLKQMSNA